MEQPTMQALQRRVERLERRLRFFYGTSLLILMLAIAGAMMQSGNAQRNPDATILRARGIIIEDEHGSERIAIGSPIPDPKEGKRRSPLTGLVINDAAGYERFGLGLMEDGSVGMGFDAPPGTGDQRNRERINIVADPKGGAYIRFLNRKTEATGFLLLDEKDQFHLEFLDFSEGKVVHRRIGFKGEERVEQDQ
jgi:hypothetical protein